MADAKPSQGFVGYPRAAFGLEANRRLANLGAGYFRLWWLLILQVATASSIARVLIDRDPSLIPLCLHAAIIGSLAIHVFSKISIGLAWNQILPVGLALVMALNGPFWAIVGRGSSWSLTGYVVVFYAVLAWVDFKAKGGLRNFGYVVTRSPFKNQEKQFKTFLQQRQAAESLPLIPENRVSSEAPEVVA